MSTQRPLLFACALVLASLLPNGCQQQPIEREKATPSTHQSRVCDQGIAGPKEDQYSKENPAVTDPAALPSNTDAAECLEERSGASGDKLAQDATAPGDPSHLTVALTDTFPPVNFVDNHNELVGFAPELSDAILRAIGAVGAHVHSPSSRVILEWLGTGRVDLAFVTGHIAERSTKLSTTAPIIEIPEVIFVRADQFDVHEPRNLKDKRVVCTPDTDTGPHLLKNFTIGCLPSPSAERTMLALASGDVDAFIYPREVGLYLVQKLNLTDKLKIVGRPVRAVPWVMAVRQDKPALLRRLDQGITKVRASGAYDRIYAKWFGRPILAGYSAQEVRFISIAAAALSLFLGTTLGLLRYNQRLRKTKANLEETIRDLEIAQDALRISEAQYHELAVNIPGALYQLRQAPDGVYAIPYVSQGIDGISGIRANEIMQNPRILLDHISEPDLRTAHRTLLESARLLKNWSEELRITSRKGEVRWLRCSATPRSVPDGGCQWNGVLLDVTERRRAEEELTRLNKHNRLLLESAGEGIYGLDNGGHCTFVNRAALQMLGYAREALIGEPMHELVHHTRSDGTPYPGEESAIYRAFREGQAVTVSDEVMWRKDGSSFPAEYSSHPIIEDDKVVGAVVVFRNVAQARAIARKMDYLATHDALTGLVNRHAFEHRLDGALASARATGVAHVLCYVDLDQFKVVNDTCGHVAGDELLRHLSVLLHAKIRQGDTLGRLGGDEFGVLLERCPTEDASRIINEIRQTVHDFRFVWEEKTFAIGISVGMVPITSETESPANALSAADTACYVAKESGRNRVHVYQADDAELATRRGEMQWVSRIHEALAEDRFLLERQTIARLPLTSDTSQRYEILARIRDRAGHNVPPGAFLPAAERFNLMPSIDRWVVRKTFVWLASKRDHILDLDFCTINLSGTTLADERFLEFVIKQLEQHRLPPRKICFEITETAAIANLKRAVQFMRALKRLGCRFALDDFGSGMSSFGYLKNLPVDFLKIDGNFVRDIVADAVDRAMVEAINQVGHVMNIRTIAEHVETDGILEALSEINVDYAQGYQIAKPRPLLDPPQGEQHRPSTTAAH